MFNTRRRHWKSTHDPFLRELMQRVAELPSIDQAFMVSIITGAHRIVSGLIGPEKRRLFRADARSLGEREFFHLYYLASAGVCGLWISRNKIKDSGRHLFEAPLGTVFRLDPLREEFYCVFMQKLNTDVSSSAFSYLLSELRRFAGEPEDVSTVEKFATTFYKQPIAFVELFGGSVDFAAALIAKNVEEWAKEQRAAGLLKE